MHLFVNITNVLITNNITYFPFGGSLISILRYGEIGIIDDDIDIVIEKPINLVNVDILELLNQFIHPVDVVKFKQGYYWKCRGSGIDVDIVMFRDDSDSRVKWGRTMDVPRNWIYPLRPCGFNQYSCPNEAIKVIQHWQNGEYQRNCIAVRGEGTTMERLKQCAMRLNSFALQSFLPLYEANVHHDLDPKQRCTLLKNETIFA